MKIAYISCHDYGKYSIGYNDEESQLLEFLVQKGLDIERRVWSDAGVDWQQYDVVVLKSPWDYHERIGEFHAWLDTLEVLGVRLLNPADMVRWNSDKRYLRDIAASGIDVIPAIYMEQGGRPDLLAAFEQLQADRVVIKPCVSAGAKNTILLCRDDIAEREAGLYELLTHESYMVQPFMEEIYAGEWSLLFFDGQYSHGILKMPGGGDYRVQHYHGGSAEAATPDVAYIASAAAIVAQYAQGALYARVDGIICNGQFCLMELELIEPYLYLDADPEARERFYRALMAMCNGIVTK